MRGLFPGTPALPAESSNREQLLGFVTTRWPTNINVVPIDYAFRPRLRDRLTLRRLPLRRNPWTFGDSVFHTVCRYSCQHSHFCNLQELSRVSLHRRQNAPLPRTPCGAHPNLRLVALDSLHFLRTKPSLHNSEFMLFFIH